MFEGREILYFMVELKKMRGLTLSITGLTERELIVLITIDEQNRQGTYEIGVQISYLSDILHTARPTMTKIINGLEEANCIKKISDKIDRRNVYLVLTSKGEKALDAAAKKIKNKLIFILGEEHTSEYYENIKHLTSLLKEIHNTTK